MFGSVARVSSEILLKETKNSMFQRTQRNKEFEFMRKRGPYSKVLPDKVILVVQDANLISDSMQTLSNNP